MIIDAKLTYRSGSKIGQPAKIVPGSEICLDRKHMTCWISVPGDYGLERTSFPDGDDKLLLSSHRDLREIVTLISAFSGLRFEQVTDLHDQIRHYEIYRVIE